MSNSNLSRRRLKRLYWPINVAFLSIYVMCFRISASQTDKMRDWSAMGLVMFLAIFLFFAVTMWIEIITGVRVDIVFGKYGLAILLAIAAIALSNFILRRRQRVQFEETFDDLPIQTRVAYRLAGLVVVVAIVSSFFLTLPIFQHTFHIVPKQ